MQHSAPRWALKISTSGGGECSSVAQCLTTGTGQRYDPETETLIPTHGGGFDVATLDGLDTARTLTRRYDGSPCPDRGPDVVAVSLNENQQGAVWASDTFQALNKGGGKPGQGYPCIAFAIQERAVSENIDAGPQGKGWQEDCAYTLEARNKVQSVAASAVRRLTPRECERLQGFPDDYTLVPNRGKPAADGPRYKALGNSMAVPVMRWIGERIQMVESRSVADRTGGGQQSHPQGHDDDE